MRKVFVIVLGLLTLPGCKKPGDKFDIRGSWYYDFGENGPLDTTVNYVELYFGDSSFYGQDETFGQGRNRLYMLDKDSIFFGDDSTDLKPFYKILTFKQDTLWLKTNPKILKNKDTVFYVKFPKNEYGHYDLAWTAENRDSLSLKVVFDYNRRMWKYHAFKWGNVKIYDSLERLGYWRWNLKEVADGEREGKRIYRRR